MTGTIEMTFYDALETRSQDQRESEQLALLRSLSAETADVADLVDLRKLPVLRKSDLTEKQLEKPPLGTIEATCSHYFQSPGPIFEPGAAKRDWWRVGRFAHAVGVGKSDIVQNTFSYHFTPAGMIFDNAAMAVGARIFPAGPGQTEAQVDVATHIGSTVYAGTPDYLGAILNKADDLGKALSFKKALVSAGPLFPQIRQRYADNGILCRQCYATADVGLIAYETAHAIDGMIVDEGVIIEIVTPGTGDPVEPGEIGELVVTVLNPDYPLVRFALGDLSAIISGTSPCGRTNVRIAGWKGRADQATKVRGMFVRTEQVAHFLARHPEISRARVEVGHDGANDTVTVKLEGAGDSAVYATSFAEIVRLRPQIELVEKGALPRDGIVIQDKRSIAS